MNEGYIVGDNIIKATGSGAATNRAGHIAASGVASALKVVPFIGTSGGAVVMTAAQYAVTLASGHVCPKVLRIAAGRSANGSMSGSDLNSTVSEVVIVHHVVH
ncbi:MAG: hypothetical protein IJT30_00565 [Muribaculaceae bacterium]|nr:hypothetical protein [Muribaculaceae bacterium]